MLYQNDFTLIKYWFLLIILNITHTEYIYQSSTVISKQGYQYSPAVPSVQFISATVVNSVKYCAMACNLNPFCRVFDYGAIISQQCRLFEGDTNKLGTIVLSSQSDSIVGTVELTSSLFTQYNQPCSTVCDESRYLTCINSTCQCPLHTYWNSSSRICHVQSPILGASCEQGMNMCREDLNYTCLQFNQCGPLSVLSGTTIADQYTTINGNTGFGFEEPYGISLYGTSENESLIVADIIAQQVVHITNINSKNITVSAIAHNITNIIGFSGPIYVFVDTHRTNDLYVSDLLSKFVVVYPMMQMTNPPLRIVVNSSQCNGATGIVMDRQQNLYIADSGNHRILLWAPNTTAGVVIVGTGTSGSNSMSLNRPRGIFLDEDNSLLYVADTFNNRIQVYYLNGTPPYNGTTVAGGNGTGSGSHQLNRPHSVWVSKRNGAIYIVEAANHRVQRWNRDASSGVTIAGSSFGISGSNATMLSYPHGLAINPNETYMYVTDGANKRIQRFDLI